ncbi:Phytanoyl-dioxygenase family protein [Pleurostoma richardsiae]|uniref:Phytanoyl-dioxygenase family protein n=1 Tax=Pleurostoma richardsiae TaxID=41990 RepID=A0AA38S4N8_9PEZI|nr:Phytanoyl-dioxygenase family protein [Pleurostoma richardsiae]
MGSLAADFDDTASKDDVVVVTISDEERRRGAYSPLSLAKVLGAMHQDGLVVLRGVIDVEHIDALNAKMCEDADKKIADPSQQYNHNVKSNFLQRPPVADSAYLHEDVYFNPYLLQVANAYLGHKPIWNWLTANTAIANTAGLRQPAHKDCSFVHPQYPYYFIANVPLCDFTVENGATEFWLGSSQRASWKDQVIAADESMIGLYGRLHEPLPHITEEAKEARMRVRPPIQPRALKGDIMIRDLRTWHAGMPNSSDKHRIMLGLGYQSPAHPNYTMRVHLPASQKEFFLSHAQDKVEVRANFYEDKEFEVLKADTYFDLRPTYLD